MRARWSANVCNSSNDVEQEQRKCEASRKAAGGSRRGSARFGTGRDCGRVNAMPHDTKASGRAIREKCKRLGDCSIHIFRFPYGMVIFTEFSGAKKTYSLGLSFKPAQLNGAGFFPRAHIVALRHPMFIAKAQAQNILRLWFEFE